MAVVWASVFSILHFLEVDRLFYVGFSSQNDTIAIDLIKWISVILLSTSE